MWDPVSYKLVSYKKMSSFVWFWQQHNYIQRQILFHYRVTVSFNCCRKKWTHRSFISPLPSSFLAPPFSLLPPILSPRSSPSCFLSPRIPFLPPPPYPFSLPLFSLLLLPLSSPTSILPPPSLPPSAPSLLPSLYKLSLTHMAAGNVGSFWGGMAYCYGDNDDWYWNICVC